MTDNSELIGTFCNALVSINKTKIHTKVSTILKKQKKNLIGLVCLLADSGFFKDF